MDRETDGDPGVGEDVVGVALPVKWAAWLPPGIYLPGITAAELLVAWRRIQIGLVLHFCLLLAVLILAALAWTGRKGRGESAGSEEGSGADGREYRFYLSLALGPLIRIISLTMPLQGIPVVYWYAIVGTPIFAAAFVATRLAGYRCGDVFLGAAAFSPGRLPLQLAVGLLGIPLGFLEFHILQPSPLVPPSDVGLLITAAMILLVFTGFMEEFIFRGLLQKAAGDYLGERPGMVYVSLLFSALHITHLSVLDVFFVLGVALLFAVLVRRTGSLLGVTLAHGLTNITLYIYWPYFHF